MPPTAAFGGTGASVARPSDRIALLLAILVVALAARVAWMHGGGAHETVVRQPTARATPVVSPRDEVIIASPRSRGLAAVGARIAGRAGWASRLPSVAIAVLSAVTMFVCGLALLDPRRPWFVAGAALSMVAFCWPSTRPHVDELFVACTSTALVASAWWYRDRRTSAKLRALSVARPTLVAAGMVIGWGALIAVRDVRDLLATPLVRKHLARTVALDSSVGHATELVRAFGVQSSP
jgi:hypothetical protein